MTKCENLLMASVKKCVYIRNVQMTVELIMAIMSELLINGTT